MNKGNLWTEEQERKLKELYSQKSPELSDVDFAAKISGVLGRDAGSIRGKIMEIKRHVISEIPDSKYKVWTDFPTFDGDALVLNDLHIPYHDGPFVRRCLELANKWNIPTTVLGGDVIEAASFSNWADDFEPGGNTANTATREAMEAIFLEMDDGEAKDKMALLLENIDIPPGDATEEIKETKKVIKALAEATGNVVSIQGNHENRILRVIRKSLSPDIAQSIFGGDNPRWKITPYYECEFTSGGRKWRVTHPINSGKGSSKKLVSKFGCNVIMAHNHHFSMQTDPSGRFLAIETGACVDRTRLSYEMQRDNAADMHVTGAVIIRDGLPHLLNEWTDWKQLSYNG